MAREWPRWCGPFGQWEAGRGRWGGSVAIGPGGCPKGKLASGGVGGHRRPLAKSGLGPVGGQRGGRCAAPLWPSSGAVPKGVASEGWPAALFAVGPPLSVGTGGAPPSRCGVASGQKRGRGGGSGAPPLRVWPVGKWLPCLEVICDTGHGVALKEGGPPDVASQYRHAFVARLEGNFVFCGSHEGRRRGKARP